MKSIVSSSMILVLSAGAAFAQQEDPAQRDAERRVRFLKERLGLTDEQAAKAVEVYKQNAEAEKKLEEERRGKIREMLTDEQKTKYDEMLKQMEGGRNSGAPGREGGREGGAPGRGPGGGPGMAFGWVERMLDGMLENLKTELALTEEQLGKTKAVFDELKKKIQDNVEELRKNGFAGVDWQEEMKKLQEQMKEYGNKVREFLTDEQKAKYDKLVEEFQNRGFGGGFGGPRAERRDGPRGPSTEERVKRAMDALKIDKADEAAAIKDLVQKVVEAQAALEAAERESRTKLDETRKNAALSEEEIANKIDELRKARKLKSDAVREAQKALYEVVNPQQEAALMILGILSW